MILDGWVRWFRAFFTGSAKFGAKFGFMLTREFDSEKRARRMWACAFSVLMVVGSNLARHLRRAQIQPRV